MWLAFLAANIYETNHLNDWPFVRGQENNIPIPRLIRWDEAIVSHNLEK